MSLSDDSGPRPCAWTARSWLANKHGGHFVAVRSSSFDLPLYDQAEIDRLSARIAELHECLTKCAESAYEAGVADERERCAIAGGAAANAGMGGAEVAAAIRGA